MAPPIGQKTAENYMKKRVLSYSWEKVGGRGGKEN
jgi:hypothetical protein